MAHPLSFMNIQANALQGQLKAFTVLQPIVLELQGTSLGPVRGQGAALYSPAGLKGAKNKRISGEQCLPLCLVLGLALWADICRCLCWDHWPPWLFQRTHWLSPQKQYCSPHQSTISQSNSGFQSPAKSKALNHGHVQQSRVAQSCVVYKIWCLYVNKSGTGTVPALLCEHECFLTWRECDTAKPTMPGLRVFFPITERMAAAKTTPLPINSRLTASHLWMKNWFSHGQASSKMHTHHFKPEVILITVNHGNSLHHEL